MHQENSPDSRSLSRANQGQGRENLRSSDWRLAVRSVVLSEEMTRGLWTPCGPKSALLSDFEEHWDKLFGKRPREELSLGLIGNAEMNSIRGVFDEQARRKPLAFAGGAGDAAGYGI